jgi:CRISPR-associated endonuclease Cas2
MENLYLIITYDIVDNKLRGKLSKFLQKYGVRVQFSVFQIANSTRVLSIVTEKIERSFSKKFAKSDSVIIFKTNFNQTIRYGNAEDLNKDLLIF